MGLVRGEEPFHVLESRLTLILCHVSWTSGVLVVPAVVARND